MCTLGLEGESTTLKMARPCYIVISLIIKVSGMGFQSAALSQKHVSNVCHTAH